MSETKKQTSRGVRKVTNVKLMEKEYNIKLESSKSANMNLSTYAKRSGLPQMARLFKKIEASQNNTETPSANERG